jgi:predicted nucleotidyltransferase
LLGAPVFAVVLLGSHAHRRARAESDLDALVVTRTAPVDRPRASSEVDLDLRVVTLADFERDGLPPWYCVGPLPVLFDTEGRARRAVEVARALYEVGPPRVSRAALADHRAWATRMLRRVEAEQAREPALAALRLARLRVRLVELAFEVRRLWPLADRAALAFWRRTEPALAEVLLLLAARSADELRLMRRLAHLALYPPAHAVSAAA